MAVPVSAIERRGIAELEQLDIRFAGELGYTIKLLAEAWLETASSWPCTSRRCCCGTRRRWPMVRGAYNAIYVVGDAVGDTLFAGQRCGQMPTASAVVADIIDLAVGRAQRTFPTLRLWSGETATASSCSRPPRCAAGSICGCWSRTGPACWPT